ncbi:MAG: hypothetical protein ACSHX9_02350 [Luteolibacter sp.]
MAPTSGKRRNKQGEADVIRLLVRRSLGGGGTPARKTRSVPTPQHFATVSSAEALAKEEAYGQRPSSHPHPNI